MANNLTAVLYKTNDLRLVSIIEAEESSAVGVESKPELFPPGVIYLFLSPFHCNFICSDPSRNYL